MNHALKALKANKLKTILIYTSLVLAITSIFLITSISNSVISMYSSLLKSDGDIIIIQAKISDTFFSNVDVKLIEEINKIKDVTKASALIVGASPVEELPIVAVYGVSKNRISNYKLKSGNYPNKKEVIVGLSIYDSLKNKNEVKIANETFKVSGVFKSQIGFENGGVVLNLDDASTIFNKSASMILVNAKVDPDIQTIVNKISKLSNEIEVKSTQNFVDNYNQFKIIKVTSNVIALIAFCMGLLGIVSMMSITINQRKSEFGIKRALGISMNKIINQILFESSILGFLAFISSFFLANIVLYIIKNIPSLHGYVNGEITTNLSIQVLVASILMAIIGSIIPALNASKTDPVSLIQGNRIW